MDNRTEQAHREIIANAPGHSALNIYRDAWNKHKPCLNNEDWAAVEAELRAAAFAEIENYLASPILGITLGPDLEGKITEQEALALVNASREFLLAGVRAMRAPKQQRGPDV